MAQSNRSVSLALEEEPGSHSLSTPLDENSGGDIEEKAVSELEKDLLLAFEEQEKPSLIENMLRNMIRAGLVTASEELKRSTPLRSQEQEELLQGAVIEVTREEDDGDNEERESQEEND
ncbi:hypothetical protein V8E51_013216 [Hyaloscypha variabilis]